MFSKTWQTSARQYNILEDRDSRIPMEDGVHLDADVFRPATNEKVPAILTVHAYEKAIQTAPIMPRGFDMVNANQEAGDVNFFVRRGYGCVVANVRGTGKSEGIYQHYGPKEVRDTCKLIEWVANQPWCNGNVAMFGISYFSIVQQQAAALNPPNLKAIFSPYGYNDFYRDKFYHGGILNHYYIGQWASSIDKIRYESWSREKWGEKAYREAIGECLADEEIAAVPYLVAALTNPDQGANSLIVDILVNRFDGEYYHLRNVDYTRDIRVPSYLGADWAHYSLHISGAARAWENLSTEKMMTIGPPIYLDRPFYQYQYESLRWFDHWLKGTENGILDEPPIKLFIVGADEWKLTSDWPPPEAKWTPFYLHANGLLSEHEFWPNEGATTFEDSYYNRDSVTFRTPTLVEDTEVVGPIVLNLYASTTDHEVLWFVSLLDIDPNGNETLLTRGWLRGSQRQLDPKKSRPWQPYHRHTQRERLTPNEIYEFNIEIRPYGILFRSGHRIGIRLKCVDDEKPLDALQGQATGHLWRQSTSRVTVYHNSECPSHLLLPITKGNVLGTFISGGKIPSELNPYRKY